jgi:uncharacterized protein YkwD
MKTILPLVLACSALGLAACGGSDGGSNDTALLASSSSVQPEPSMLYQRRSSGSGSTTTGSGSTTTGTGTSNTGSTAALDTRLTCNLPNFQQDMMNRINAARASGRTCGSTQYGPAPALTWNTYLFNAASGHSTDMASNNYFSHTGLDGSNPGQRITGAGYAWNAYGENIAAGQSSVQSVVDGWLASPGHCANIMNPKLADVGVACVSSSTSTYRTYWTMDLGHSY